MSENLDLVRSIFADWERGDFSHTANWGHPEMEYVQADGPHPGTWIGRIPEAGRDFASAWEHLRVEVDEYRELDAERVLVLTRVSGRGKKSGVELSQLHGCGANLMYIRDGKVAKCVTYFDRDRALADLGLEE
jgi:ketosteroid isomerase-like protein